MLRTVAFTVVIALSAGVTARADEGARYVATADEAACDRLAAHPLDEDTPEGVTGVDAIAEDTVAEALRVCTAAVTAGSPLRRIAFEYGRALEWADRPADAAIAYQKAVDAGSTIAMAGLAALYIQGTGVGQDYARAKELLETAAARGNVVAMDNLGSIAGGALGDEADLAKAREWFGKAAAAGFGELMLQLGLMDRDGDGAPADDAAAKAWFEKAAAKDVAAAYTSLGEFAEAGRAGPKDPSAALRFYAKGAALGDADAAAALNRLKCPYVLKDKSGKTAARMCFGPNGVELRPEPAQ